MNVILLAPTPPPYGGIAGWTNRMLNSNLKNGWTVSVVDEKIIGKRNVFSTNKINFFVEIKRCFKIWHNLRIELLNKDSKIVQVCIPAGFRSMLRECISGLIVKLHHRKFIVHFRCTLPNMIVSKSSLFVFKLLLFFSDHVFVLNNASADFLSSHDVKINYSIIPNFIEQSSTYKRKVYSDVISRAIYVGGVVEDKGCDLIANLALHFPNIEFVLVGNVEMNISQFPSNVKCIGKKSGDEVKKELDSSDVFLFFSRFKGEGFSNSLAEAMARSLPCIVSDWAANKDMIESGGGIVLSDYSVENAINALESINNKSIRKKMGEWNYSKIVNSYSDKIVLDMYVDAYEQILKKK